MKTVAETWDQIMADKDAVDEMRYELHQMERQSFMAKYQDGGRECFFAYSLLTARWDDCAKDVRRGRLTQKRAAEIIADAVKHHILTEFAAEGI